MTAEAYFVLAHETKLSLRLMVANLHAFYYISTVVADIFVL